MPRGRTPREGTPQDWQMHMNLHVDPAVLPDGVSVVPEHRPPIDIVEELNREEQEREERLRRIRVGMANNNGALPPELNPAVDMEMAQRSERERQNRERHESRRQTPPDPEPLPVVQREEDIIEAMRRQEREEENERLERAGFSLGTPPDNTEHITDLDRYHRREQERRTRIIQNTAQALGQGLHNLSDAFHNIHDAVRHVAPVLRQVAVVNPPRRRKPPYRLRRQNGNKPQEIVLPTSVEVLTGGDPSLAQKIKKLQRQLGLSDSDIQERLGSIAMEEQMKEQEDDRKYLTAEEVKTIVKMSEGNLEHSIIVRLLINGVSPKEIHRIRAKDVKYMTDELKLMEPPRKIKIDHPTINLMTQLLSRNNTDVHSTAKIIQYSERGVRKLVSDLGEYDAKITFPVTPQVLFNTCFVIKLTQNADWTPEQLQQHMGFTNKDYFMKLYKYYKQVVENK